MIHKKSALHFECTQCGACCHGNNDDYIAIEGARLKLLCQHLDISMAWLKKRYVSYLGNSLYTIRFDYSGRCTFLGQSGQCRIYPVRPIQCQTYPWWPEVLESKRAWDQEKLRCEGINHGRQVPVSRIMKALKQQQAFEKDYE